jgi:hypothetical protein
MVATSTQDSATADPGSTADGAGRSAFPQFAVTMANQQIAKVGETLVGAADSLDDLIAGSGLPIGEDLKRLATDATERLRSAGTSIGEQDAGILLGELQQGAAARPTLSLVVGAGLGAILAYAFLRTAPTSAATEPSQTL